MIWTRPGSSVVENAECRGFESHPRQLILLWKSDCLGCAVLLCLVVCLTLLASFFLPSASLINMHIGLIFTPPILTPEMQFMTMTVIGI